MKKITRIMLKVAVFVVVGIFSLQTGALEGQGVEFDIFEIDEPVQMEMRPVPRGWPQEPEMIRHPKGADRPIYWTPGCHTIK